MNKHLDDNYLPELFRACLNRKDVLLVVKQHLKKSFLPEESGYREVWEEMLKYLSKEDKPPSIGILNQILKDKKALSAVAEIKDIVKPDYEGLVKSFEEFVRQHRFVELYESVGDTYNEGKTDEAYSSFAKGAQELMSFTLRQALHDKIFKGFNVRFATRLLDAAQHKEKTIPLGIDLLDYRMNGGPQRGESTLFLGDSGIGKSQLLIHAGIAAARRGFKVAHFQAEGTRQQAMDRYDAAWTGTLYRDMKVSNIDADKHKVLQEIIKRIGGEVYIEAREKFGAWSMMDIRNSIIGMFRAYGRIDLAIIDYLDLIEPGDGNLYRASEERFRQQAVARMMKDIAVEFDVSVLTVTQASAIPPDARKDPDFILTRWNLSEDKGKLRPFDNFITLNQTRDEMKNGIIRIHTDKLREHDSSNDPITIAQNLKRARFYDRRRTIEEVMEDDILSMLKLRRLEKS